METPIDDRIKNFTYYFIRKVEDKLTYYLDILEEKSTTAPTSKAGTSLSAATSLVPYIGKGASETVKEGDTLILKKLDKKNAKAAAKIIYHHRNNRDDVRKLLAKAAYELFCCFEIQFMEVTCDGGHIRAMQKLGYDAGQRFIDYVIRKKLAAINTKLILDGITSDNPSLLNTLGVVKLGRTVKNSEHDKWNSSEIYTKVGVYIEKSNTCYIKKTSDITTYGYRRKFKHESVKDIESNWKKYEFMYTYNYKTNLDDFDNIYPSIIEFIYKQDPHDYAKYDREMKYSEIVRILSKYHMESLEASANQYLDAAEHREMLHISIIEETSKNHHEVTTMLSKISETQESLVRQQSSSSVTPLKPAIDIVSKIVVKNIIKPTQNGSVGKKIKSHLKKLNPTQNREFKRLKDNILKLKL